MCYNVENGRQTKSVRKNFSSISTKVQEKVKVAVENMTGLTVADVNVRVAGVEVE